MINVVLADDHVLVRDGIKALLEDQTGITVIDEASNGKEALEVISKNKPDVLIVDIRMPEMNGIEVVAEINKNNFNVKTLVLSMHDSEEYVVKSIQAGADGYLLKGASKEEFLKAVNNVAVGGKYFTGDVSTIIMNNFVSGNKSKVLKEEKDAKELPFIQAMHRYVIEDSTSLWRTEQFEGYEIGAQAYLGGVLGFYKDAMKNSDYGAMWMLTTIAHDSVLRRTRLPYARNFKLTQQQQTPGFFQGAAVGQYYLSKRAQFTEEWGLYVEPIGLTYYIMLDLGNILLFRPDDDTLRENLRLGAEKLLDWQHADGHWEVAYDRASHAPRFTRLQDLRPTFYGLLVAYRILGDERYLDAARRGADWFVENATERGHFLGVCGDLRFVPDFATGQSVQALLDLFRPNGRGAVPDGSPANRPIVHNIDIHASHCHAGEQGGGRHPAPGLGDQSGGTEL